MGWEEGRTEETSPSQLRLPAMGRLGVKISPAHKVSMLSTIFTRGELKTHEKKFKFVFFSGKLEAIATTPLYIIFRYFDR